jgi:hypothetical protein
MNRVLAEQGWGNEIVIRMMFGPNVELAEPMDPVVFWFLYAGVPIIAVALVLCVFIWIKNWYITRRVKLGADEVEDVILKRLPMPTIEEVGQDVVTERELAKDLVKGGGTVEDQIVRKYKSQQVAKIKKTRSTSEADKIAYDMHDFHYRDAGKEVAGLDGVVSAFLTTGKFETNSDTTSDVGIMQTYQRLEKFHEKIKEGASEEGTEALWKDAGRVKDLLVAGARVPKSKGKSAVLTGPMPDVKGSRDLKKQVASQHRQVSELGGHTMPEFIKDRQLEHFRDHPEPLKLGKRIDDAAKRGPRNNDDAQDAVLMLENGHSGNTNGTAKNAKSPAGMLALTKLMSRGRASSTKKDKDKDDGEGLEVMV